MNKKTHTVVCYLYHSVALLSNGTVRCWGNNTWNQCNPIHRAFTDVIQIACGNTHSVVLLSNGTVESWGGKQGDLYKTLTDVIQIACGHFHSIVLLTNGTIRCWGDNKFNQCDPVHLTLTDVMMPSCNCLLW